MIIDTTQAWMTKIPDQDYKAIEEYVAKNIYDDIAKITHVTGTNKYILHPSNSDDEMIEIQNGKAEKSCLTEEESDDN